jgi:hypothetical protein
MTTPHNWSAFRRQTADHIAREGRSILGVGGGKYGEPPFSYTIGNHFEGLPELLLIGSARTPYLNDLSQLMIARGEPFRDGEIVALPMLSLPLKLVCVDDIRAWENYTVQAGEHLGHDGYDIMQAVLSDKEGRFPDDPGCDKPWSLFPILRLGARP